MHDDRARVDGAGGGGGRRGSREELRWVSGAGGAATHSSLGAEGGGGPSGDAELGVHAGCGRLVFPRNFPLITTCRFRPRRYPATASVAPRLFHRTALMHPRSTLLVHRHVLDACRS